MLYTLSYNKHLYSALIYSRSLYHPSMSLDPNDIRWHIRRSGRLHIIKNYFKNSFWCLKLLVAILCSGRGDNINK